MTVHIVTIATSISGLSVAGLKVFDLDDIKEMMQPRDLPCLMPHPLDSVTNFEITQDITGNSDIMSYTMNYRLYYRPVVGTLKFFGPYADLMAMVEKIINAVIDLNETATTYNIYPSIQAVGGVPDAAGNIYHGCDFQFNITE